MSGILQKGARRFTTQIGAAGVPDEVTTTIPLVSVTGLPTDTQIELVIDRTDASGNLTPAKEEVVRGTVSGTSLINCTRAVEGTAQAHAAGATVNSFLTASMWNNIIEYTRDLPTKGLINGKIVPSVASNNLTVAIKTLQDTDPSVTNPVGIWIGNELRWITEAMNTSMPAGFNAFNAASNELKDREIDYFVYIGKATSGGALSIGFARIPYARLGSDFNTSFTNERYGRFDSANIEVNNITEVVNIGRFAATLSTATNWSVPTFTNANLIQEPIYETRWLLYTPTWVGSVTNPAIGNGTLTGKYMITKEKIRLSVYVLMGSTTTYGSGSWAFNTPMSSTSGQNLGGGTGSGHAYNGNTHILSTGPNYTFGLGSYSQIFATTSGNAIISPTAPFTWAAGSYGIMGIEYIIT